VIRLFTEIISNKHSIKKSTRFQFCIENKLTVQLA